MEHSSGSFKLNGNRFLHALFMDCPSVNVAVSHLVLTAWCNVGVWNFFAIKLQVRSTNKTLRLITKLHTNGNGFWLLCFALADLFFLS